MFNFPLRLGVFARELYFSKVRRKRPLYNLYFYGRPGSYTVKEIGEVYLQNADIYNRLILYDKKYLKFMLDKTHIGCPGKLSETTMFIAYSLL